MKKWVAIPSVWKAALSSNLLDFKQIDPSADISIDLQAPYDMALELFQAKQNKTD